MLYREHPHRRGPGRHRKLPRLKVRNTPACEARNVLTYSPKLRRVPWLRYRVKDGEKGPMVWEAKCLPVWIKDENGLPVGSYRLLMTRNVLKPEEVKFFLSNAPEGVPVETLLLVAFSRWRIERMFEDSKDQLGMDHFEVRKYGSIQRHLILTCVSHLFLAEFRQGHRGKKPGSDDLPATNSYEGPRTLVAPGRAVLNQTSRIHRRAIDLNAEAERRLTARPPEADDPAITGHCSIPERPSHVQMAEKVAL